MRRAPLALLALAACIQVETSEEPPAGGGGGAGGPVCGDGVVDDGEGCDDGAANDDAAPHGACTRACQPARCGDGLRAPEEACDHGADNGVPGTPCLPTCEPGCGDGVVQDGEACDFGAEANDDRLSTCTDACTVARCGDGLVQAWEACDGGAGCTERCTPADLPCFPAFLDASKYASLVALGDGRVVGFGERNTLGLAAHVSVPTVLDLPPLRAVSLGRGFGAGVAEDGTLWTWGNNHRGQRGLGHFDAVATRTQVMPERRFRAVAAHELYVLALAEDGDLFAFGSNEAAKLGTERTTGVPCAGALYDCYSEGDCQADLTCEGATADAAGSCSTFCQASPQQVSRGKKFVDVAAGGYHAVALRDDGVPMAWGFAYYGQIGTGERGSAECQSCYQFPREVAGVGRARRIAAGPYHTLLVDAAGKLLGFGRNQNGQLGRGAEELLVPTPVSLALPAGVTVHAVATGEAGSTLAHDSEGTLWGFGNDASGQLGHAPEEPVQEPLAVELPAEAEVLAFAVGSNHALVSTRDGRVFAFGFDDVGQQGDGAPAEAPHPPHVVSVCP